jgi:hypothetical protein
LFSFIICAGARREAGRVAARSCSFLNFEAKVRRHGAMVASSNDGVLAQAKHPPSQPGGDRLNPMAHSRRWIGLFSSTAPAVPIGPIIASFACDWEFDS